MTESYGPLNLYPRLREQSSTEYQVEKYLEVLEARPKYMVEHIGASFDAENWANKRRSLASQLLKEATRLREAPEVEREWEMRVEEN